MAMAMAMAMVERSRSWGVEGNKGPGLELLLP